MHLWIFRWSFIGRVLSDWRMRVYPTSMSGTGTGTATATATTTTHNGYDDFTMTTTSSEMVSKNFHFGQEFFRQLMMGTLGGISAQWFNPLFPSSCPKFIYHVWHN